MDRFLVPRPLELLRIDDDLPDGVPTTMPLQFIEQLPPSLLKPVMITVGGVQHLGIKSWAMAVQYWKQGRFETPPDLIISDVQFVDKSSPMASMGTNLKLPTGLSHFKLFAALARLRGGPVGVALHTADPMLWEMSARSDDPVERLLGLLAAHEIGELAALLGDAEGIPEGGAEACWAWLKQARNMHFNEAIPVALEGYRRRLGEVTILPDDHARLACWCAGMQENARNNPRGRVYLDESNDIGIPIFRLDGTRDIVSIRSVFADVSLKSLGFTFDLTGLEADTFALDDDPEFYRLTEAGMPKIGALVAACGNLTRTYSQALCVLGTFPPIRIEASDVSLTKFIKDNVITDQAAALAILLQHVAYNHKLDELWRAAFVSCGYDPARDVFCSETDVTLQTWLDRVYRIAKSSIDELSLGDFKNRLNENAAEFGRVSKAGLTRLLALLVSLRWLVSDPDTAEYRATKAAVTGDIPRLPADTPEGFLLVSGLTDDYQDGNDLREIPGVMLHLFGHDEASPFRRSDNHNGLPRIIASGFALDSNDAATRFLDAFREGTMPGWVREICRQFARQLPDWDQARWPTWLAD